MGNHTKTKIDHNSIEIKVHNAENQPFTLTNIPLITNTSLEASPKENMDTITQSKPMNSNLNETTETNFNSTLIDDGTLFSSHTVNTLSLIHLENNNNNNKNNNNTNNHEVIKDTTNNKNNYENHRNKVVYFCDFHKYFCY